MTDSKDKEKVIQFQYLPDHSLVILTSEGRMFVKIDEWFVIDLPDDLTPSGEGEGIIN